MAAHHHNKRELRPSILPLSPKLSYTSVPLGHPTKLPFSFGCFPFQACSSYYQSPPCSPLPISTKSRNRKFWERKAEEPAQGSVVKVVKKEKDHAATETLRVFRSFPRNAYPIRHQILRHKTPNSVPLLPRDCGKTRYRRREAFRLPITCSKAVLCHGQDQSANLPSSHPAEKNA